MIRSPRDLPPAAQLLAITLVTSAIACAVAWPFWLSPSRAANVELGDRIRAVRATTVGLPAAVGQVAALEPRVGTLAATVRAHAARLEQAPSSDWVLAELTEVAGIAGVDVVHFKPKPAVDRRTYRELSVDIGVEGDFHDTARLIDVLTSVPPSFGVSRLHVKSRTRQGARGSVTSTFVLSAYGGLSGEAGLTEVDELEPFRPAYSDEGRRDPFASLALPVHADTARAARRRGLSAIPLAEVIVRGVAGSGRRMLAILESSSHQSFVVRVADRLADSSVVAIDAAGVVFARGGAGRSSTVRKPIARGPVEHQ